MSIAGGGEVMGSSVGTFGIDEKDTVGSPCGMAATATKSGAARRAASESIAIKTTETLCEQLPLRVYGSD